MNNNTEYGFGLSCYISIESIYRDSIAHIILMGPIQYFIKLDSEIIRCIKGKATNESYIEAEIADGSFIIELDTIGIVKERAIITDQANPAINHYGMRCYPFISSYINLKIITKKIPLSSVIFELPDSFRFIWYLSGVYSPSGAKAEIRHSFGDERSKYFFSWNTRSETEGNFIIKIPVRLGGHKLLKIIVFPTYYYVLTLMGIAIASYEKLTIFLAAMGAAWVFMVKWWYSSNLPQQNTLLTHGYIIAGIFIPIWGFAWKIFGWGAIVFLFPVILLLLYIHNVLKEFKINGELPYSLARYWYNKMNKSDLTQREAQRRKVSSKQDL